MEEDEEKLLFWDLIPCGSSPCYWSAHTWNKLCSTAGFPASSTPNVWSDSSLVLYLVPGGNIGSSLALLRICQCIPILVTLDNQFLIQTYLQMCHGIDTPRKWLEIHALNRNLDRGWAPCSIKWYWNFFDCWRLSTACSTKLHPMWEHPPILFSFILFWEIRVWTTEKLHWELGNWSKEKKLVILN